MKTGERKRRKSGWEMENGGDVVLALGDGDPLMSRQSIKNATRVVQTRATPPFFWGNGRKARPTTKAKKKQQQQRQQKTIPAAH